MLWGIAYLVEHEGEGAITFLLMARGAKQLSAVRHLSWTHPLMKTASVPTGPSNFSLQRPSEGVTLTGSRAVSFRLSGRGRTPEHNPLLSD